MDGKMEKCRLVAGLWLVALVAVLLHCWLGLGLFRAFWVVGWLCEIFTSFHIAYFFRHVADPFREAVYQSR
jgi:hypothetical protein